MQSGKMTVSVRLWKTGSENIRLSRKNEKNPRQTLCAAGDGFPPRPHTRPGRRPARGGDDMQKNDAAVPDGANDTRGFGPRPALRSAILPPLPRRLEVRPLRRLPDRGGKDLDFTARSASWRPGWNCPAGGAPGTYCPALFAAGGR